MPKLIGIAIKHKKRGPMHTLDTAHVGVAGGVDMDFRGKPSKRQVTVISEKAWQETIAELGVELLWTTRRANLLVDDINLENTIGKTINIGELTLLITQETDPCERMDEAHAGLFEALRKNWRGGVCCRVICEGQIKIGDEVQLSDVEINE